MKLVFDNGKEQEIRESDFYRIITRAEEYANKSQCNFLDASELHTKQGDYKMSLLFMEWADDESSVATICNTLENLYFSNYTRN